MASPSILAHSGLGKHEAQHAGLRQDLPGLQAQAATLAYIDTFMVLAVGSAIMFFLSFALKKNDPGGGGEAGSGLREVK